MDLSKRQQAIVGELLRSNDAITIKELAFTLKVSERTIRYDLDHIDYVFNSLSLKIHRTPKVGVSIPDKESVLHHLDGPSVAFVPTFEKQERLMYEALILLTTHNDITSEELANLLKTSRSTVFNDLKQLGKILAQEGLLLEAKKHYGYQISGDLDKINSYFTKLVKEFLDSKKSGFTIYPLTENIGLMFSDDRLNMIRKLIKKCKNSLNFWLPYESYMQLVARLSIVIEGQRRLESETLDLPWSLSDKPEHKITLSLAELLSEDFQIDLSKAEKILLTQYLMRINVKLSSSEQSVVDPKLLDTVYEMIKLLQNYLAISPDNIYQLKQELVSHLELTLEKIHFNIPNVNTLLDDIKMHYYEEFHIAKLMLSIFEKAYDVEVNDDEAGFITMYILKNKEKSILQKQKNILVVCCSGRGASKFLATRIRNNIPGINIKNIVSAFEIEGGECEMSDVELIISTVDIHHAAKPVVKVSPLITNAELGKISKILFNEDLSLLKAQSQRKRNLSEQLEYRIKSMVEPKLANQLMVKLNTVISDFEQLNNKDLFYQEDVEKPAQLIGMVLMDIGGMIHKLKDLGHHVDDVSVWGLVLHIVLAVPRWQAGSFNVEPDIESYKKIKPDLYQVVEETIRSIELNFDFRILESEIIAIMRYVS